MRESKTSDDDCIHRNIYTQIDVCTYNVFCLIHQQHTSSSSFTMNDFSFVLALFLSITHIWLYYMMMMVVAMMIRYVLLLLLHCENGYYYFFIATACMHVPHYPPGSWFGGSIIKFLCSVINILHVPLFWHAISVVTLNATKFAMLINKKPVVCWHVCTCKANVCTFLSCVCPLYHCNEKHSLLSYIDRTCWYVCVCVCVQTTAVVVY